MTSIIQSLWIGPQLSPIEQLCIKSFLNLGYKFELYTYDDIEGVPEGTTVCDANEILSYDKVFKTHNGSLAHFADWFRWKLLYERGGIWVDMDLIGIKRFDPTKEILFGHERYGRPNISFLKFPKGHILCQYMANACEYPNKILSYDNFRTRVKKVLRFIIGNKRSFVGWGEAGGPIGFAKAVNYFKLSDHAEPFPAFYPVPAHCWQNIFDNTFLNYPSMIQDSYAIHLWNEHIRRSVEFDINITPDPNSLFSHLESINSQPIV